MLDPMGKKEQDLWVADRVLTILKEMAVAFAWPGSWCRVAPALNAEGEWVSDTDDAAVSFSVRGMAVALWVQHMKAEGHASGSWNAVMDELMAALAENAPFVTPPRLKSDIVWVWEANDAPGRTQEEICAWVKETVDDQEENMRLGTYSRLALRAFDEQRAI